MKILKSVYTFIKALWLDIDEKRVIGTASNLTYSTLLAFVPIMAVVFAIARGFGYSIYIEQWFSDSLSSQPEAAKTIIGFVNSYLVNTQKGIFLGVGLMVMLWTVLMLISNIEMAFNDIWQVKHQRSIFRTVTDYIAMMFLLPIVIVLSSGLSIFISTLGNEFSEMMLIGPIMSFFIKLAPYILLCCAFTALYIFMPNTKVRWKSAIFPGILAGVSMQVFQMLYINSQIWISKYNAIYGSFAMIPFFLLWLQISWIICLIGAELTYCRQNSEDFLTEWMPSEPLSFNNRERYSWSIMEKVLERFRNGAKPINVWEIKQSLGLSRRTVNTLLYDLQRIHFIIELTHDEKSDTPKYVPAEAPENLTRENLKQRLADLGA